MTNGKLDLSAFAGKLNRENLGYVFNSINFIGVLLSHLKFINNPVVLKWFIELLKGPKNLITETLLYKYFTKYSAPVVPSFKKSTPPAASIIIYYYACRPVFMGEST